MTPKKETLEKEFRRSFEDLRSVEMADRVIENIQLNLLKTDVFTKKEQYLI